MANEKRLIKADPIYNGILIYMASNAYLNDTALDALKMVAKWIEEAPTENAVKHGRWILRVENNNCDMTYQYECNKCGQTLRQKLVTNFCPECGARMDMEAINE